MKELNKILYDILLKLNKSSYIFEVNKDLIFKYFSDFSKLDFKKYNLFEDYLKKFYHFCFELKPQSMIKEALKFKV